MASITQLQCPFCHAASGPDGPLARCTDLSPPDDDGTRVESAYCHDCKIGVERVVRGPESRLRVVRRMVPPSGGGPGRAA